MQIQSGVFCNLWSSKSLFGDVHNMAHGPAKQFAEEPKTIREAGYVMTPEELKEYRDSLFDEEGHFISKMHPVQWVHKEKTPPEPEPLPIKRFLKVLAVALIGLAAALSLAVILAG